MYIYMRIFVLKAKSYVSEQIMLFVHANSIVRRCKFRCGSLKIPLCVHANEWQRPKNTFLFAEQFFTIYEPKLVNLISM